MSNSEFLTKMRLLRSHMCEINSRLLMGEASIPVHLAIGAESIAVLIDSVRQTTDHLLLSHRNIHHNLMRLPFDFVTDSIFDPIGKMKHGSMNLHSPAVRNPYTSSLLANHLSIAVGLSLGKKLKGDRSRVFISIGDGAIEEGTFYECLQLIAKHKLNICIVLEDNSHSMSSSIESRRPDFSLSKLMSIFNIAYGYFGNESCAEAHSRMRRFENGPTLLHFKYTLFSNHAGPTPGWPADIKTVECDEEGVIVCEDIDPIYRELIN